MPIPVTSDAEVLRAVPYLLGFQPQSSVVLLATRSGTLTVTARIDLPERAHQRPAWLTTAVEAATRYLPTGVGVIGFDPVERCGPLLQLLAGRLRRRGIDVYPLLLAGPLSWRHLDPRACTRCATAGHPPPEPDTVVDAEFVARGRAPFPSRAALADALAPDEHYLAALDDLGPPPLPEGNGHVPTDRAEGPWSALTDVGRAWAPVPEELGALAASASVADWRDAVLARIVPDLIAVERLVPFLAHRAAVTIRVPSATSDQARGQEWQPVILDRLSLLARRSPRPLAAGPYAMLAVVAGCWGDGVTAVVAAAQACRADPGHVLAGIVLQVYACGRSLAPPDRIPGRHVG